MHLAPFIQDLAIILAIAGLVTLIFRKINQPVVLGYVVAGFIIGPYTPPFPLITEIPSIKVWAELGLIFLMFSLGLEFTFHKLSHVGPSATGTALIEVPVMMVLGFLTGQTFGWSTRDCLFLGGMLSISSTTLIVKVFEEKKLKARQFANVVFGVLIVEDIIAILLLATLSTLGLAAEAWGIRLLSSVVQLILVVGGWFLVGYFLIPAGFRYFRRWLENETLIIVSVGLCLLLVVFATKIGYSAALGAFVMGSILAETGEHSRIESLLMPLRDVFVAIFFVSVGMLVDPSVLMSHSVAIVLLTALTIGGKIFGATTGALLTGQSFKQSMLIGFCLGQIGEFSFIIATLGATLGIISDFLYPIAVAISATTMFTTPFLIGLAEPLADRIERVFPKKWQAALVNYSLNIQRSRNQSPGARPSLISLVTFALNGLIVGAIFLYMDHYGEPKLEKIVVNPVVSNVLSWVSCLVLASPFIWGMLSAYRKKEKKSSGQDFRTSSLISQLAVVAWMGLLTTLFFTTGISLLLTLGTAVLLFVMFYQQLEKSYVWLESRLRKNLETSHRQDSESKIHQLAPWDLQLAKFTVHPNSSVTGKSLLEGKYRENYGINIVGIRRGLDTIFPPPAKEMLFPGDELLVLGTESQLEKLRTLVETYPTLEKGFRDLSNFELKRILIDPSSPYAGKTIRDSGIRNELKGLVVGFERGRERQINPNPNDQLAIGDVLWVIGAVA